MTHHEPNTQPMDVTVRCAVCAEPASRVQLIAPGGRPGGFATWPTDDQEIWLQHRDQTRWRFAYEGIEGGNGWGDDIDEPYAARLAYAFAEPLTFEGVRTAGLYDDAGFCSQCERPYCFDHWNDPERQRPDGTCPRGHWKSLDPHWSPV